MLTLGIEYLTGYAVATDTSDRHRPEWPPHPARVFMAMAAAYFETGEDPKEKDALLWLERLDEHPTLFASECDERPVVTHYVPVNDELNPVASSLPMLRRRQARGFPRVRPHDPRVLLRWEGAHADAQRLAALDSLCRKVSRIGHSSSLVRMWAAEDLPVDSAAALLRWVSDDDHFETQLRTITGDSFDQLVSRFRSAELAEFDRLSAQVKTAKGREKAEARRQLSEEFNDLRPQPHRPEFRITAGYRRERAASPPPSRSIWDERLLVFALDPSETSHARLDIRASLAITRALRDAAMSVAGAAKLPIAEALSGHRTDGSPSESPHCAFFTLPFVGRTHADGHVLGAAVAFPRELSPDNRRRISGLLGAVQNLTLGPLGKWALIGFFEAGDIHNLRPMTWSAAPQGAVEWATVTPIVFDEHPKTKAKSEYLEEVSAMIRRACERVMADAPKVISIVPSHVSRHDGVPTAREFPRLKRKDGSERRHLHATIVFDQPVIGPILLGAGRYRGYGLLRPTKRDQS